MTRVSIRQTLLLASLFVIAGVTLVILDNNHTLDPLKSGLHDAVEPAVDWINDLTGDDGVNSDVEVKLQQVTDERDALLAENALLKLELEGFEDLQQVLEVQQEHPEYNMVAANVVNPDPSGLQKLVTIDRGSRDGIEVGMAVIDPYYFVGLVTSVEEDSARVTLAIDASSSVGAKLLDTQGVGIVYGKWQSGGRMELQHVDRSIVPGKDEVVVTSDEPEFRTAKVPGGLIIGKVTGEPVLDNQADSQTIEVLPASNFDDLSVVAVLLPPDPDA